MRNPSNKEEALDFLSQGYKVNLNDELKSDPQVMLAVARYDITLFHQVSSHLASNKAFMLQALDEDARSLAWAAKELKSDKELVLTAIKKSASCLIYASKEIKDLCKGHDPMDVLQRVCLSDKLEKDLTHNEASKKRMKI